MSFSGNKIMIQEEELPPGVNHLDTNRGSHQTRRKSTEIAEDKLRRFVANILGVNGGGGRATGKAYSLY